MRFRRGAEPLGLGALLPQEPAVRPGLVLRHLVQQRPELRGPRQRRARHERRRRLATATGRAALCGSSRLHPPTPPPPPAPARSGPATTPAPRPPAPRRSRTLPACSQSRCRAVSPRGRRGSVPAAAPRPGVCCREEVAGGDRFRPAAQSRPGLRRPFLRTAPGREGPGGAGRAGVRGAV